MPADEIALLSTKPFCTESAEVGSGTESPFHSSMNSLLSRLLGSRWCSRYSCTISSVMLPVLHAPYPIAQKCLPQYLRFNSGYSCWSNREVRTLNLFTKSEIDFDDGYSMCICTWSLLTTPFSIFTSSVSQICTIKSRHLTLISPCSTWYRYFVTQTIWAVSLVTLWLLWRLSFTAKLLTLVEMSSN